MKIDIRKMLAVILAVILISAALVVGLRSRSARADSSTPAMGTNMSEARQAVEVPSSELRYRGD